MTYIFTGVLSEDLYEGDFPVDSPEAVYRQIDHPKLNMGVLFPKQAENHIEKPDSDTQKLIQAAGVKNGIWLYYMCWGGELEAVAIAKMENGKILMETYKQFEDIEYTELH